MSDRLKELQHQRALAQQQVDWLDREIARELGAAPKPAVTAPFGASISTSPTAPLLSLAPAANVVLAGDADKLIEQYRPKQTVKSEVRLGCFVYFFAAFAVVGIIVGLLYFFRRGH